MATEKKNASALTENEKTYRRTINRIAITMLIFFGIFTIISGVILVTDFLTGFLPDVAGEVTYQLIYALCYSAAFVVPVFFWRLLVPKKERMPMLTEGRLPRETVLYIFVGIAIIYAAAQINALLLEPFSYNDFMDDIMSESMATQKNYQLVLAFLVTAVLPGFVEELLFRGLVLTNLLPYGRTTAVVISALLFGIMHQNAGQFLYATAAGLVLGFVYVRTRSIFVTVLMHFCNNFLSVLTMALGERLPLSTAYPLISAINALVAVIGIFGAVMLIFSVGNREKALLREGAFEKELPLDPEYAEIDVPAGRRVKLFFSPLMIVYLCLCVAEMAFLLMMPWLSSLLGSLV